jgi:hypothetical protein
MHSHRVDQQSKRGRAPGPPRQDRAQEGIFDPNQRHPCPGGDPLAAPGGRTCAPDQHTVLRPRPSDAQLVSGKLQHPVQPPVAQEAQVLMIKPPGHSAQGGGGARQTFGQLPTFAVSASPVAAVVEPVIAPSVFCHCTNGASVT